MSLLRRSLIASAFSAAFLRNLPVQAQSDYDDWLDSETLDFGASPEQEALTRYCSTQDRFDGYTIRMSINDNQLSATATFEDAGFHIRFGANPDGTRNFVRGNGDIGELRLESIGTTRIYFHDFAKTYFNQPDMSAPLVLRADDLDSGDYQTLKGTISTGPKLTSNRDEQISVKCDLPTGTLTRKKFYNMIAGGRRIRVSLGCYVEKDDRWYLIKRATIENSGLERSLAKLSGSFVGGLSNINYGECRSACFLTTACCEAYGKADDCIELEILRDYRDGWLAAQPGGAAQIAEYDVIAPRICAALARDTAGGAVTRAIYWRTILPCAALIRLGLKRPARVLYTRLVERLMARYGISAA